MSANPADAKPTIVGIKRIAHFPGAPGWEEVADHAIAWAMNPTAAESRQAAPASA